MNAINERLLELEARRTPVTIGLIGAGQMGQEILCQVQLMKGVRVPVVVDVSFERVELACRMANIPAERIVRATDLDTARRAIAGGRCVAATDWQLVTALPEVQVVVDATGVPEVGAAIALATIAAHKHIVMMNVECDVTIGAILRRKAEAAGVIYSLAAGDEPAAILELYRFARALGFEVVCAGKGKNNPLDITATPDSLAEKARARDMSARMLCEFVDGSKTAVEMCSVANATGLVPDVRGMHGATATRDTLHKVFCPRADGGVLNRKGVVDFAIGVHPGVFVVFTTDHARLKHGLIQRDMGTGPHYLLFRPYHLCSIEVPLTCAQAVIYGESSGHPLPRPVAECLAIAKRDLRIGETLDAIGEYCYRGSIDTVEAARAENLLPLGLAKGCVLKRAVPRGQPIRYDDVESVPDTLLARLRREQDQVCFGPPAPAPTPDGGEPRPQNKEPGTRNNERRTTSHEPCP
ncbi:MAG: NAD(P)-dependent oxidoreductase [Verrucomicrobia bacterium]|nr:NAD(P)-dependent oxidoreductase [Verrucomicrobiota bacterium]